MTTRKKSPERFKSLGSRRWRATDARMVLEALESSGASAAAFAREHGLCAQRILWWRRRLAEPAGGKQVEGNEVSFAPVLVRHRAPSSAVTVRVASVEISVSDPATTEPSWVAELVTALGGG